MWHVLTHNNTCRFVPVSVLQLVESDGALVNIEPELHGKFVKHNDNDGNVESKELVRKNSCVCMSIYVYAYLVSFAIIMNEGKRGKQRFFARIRMFG